MGLKKVRFTLVCICFLFALLAMPSSAKAKPAPTKLTLSHKKLVLYAGESKKLAVYKVKPEGASGKVIWKSQNKKIAEVSRYGRVTAKKKGKTVIIASSQKQPSVKVTLEVVVKKRPVRKEKECGIVGDVGWSGNLVDVELGYQEFYSIKDMDIVQSVIIIRSENGLDEVRKILKKMGFYSTFWRKKLTEYREIDYSKYSLILLTHTPPTAVTKCAITSFSTEYDSEGKLQGIIKYDYTPLEYDGDGIGLNDARAYNFSIKMKKSDEAMINYYRVGDSVYDDKLLFP